MKDYIAKNNLQPVKIEHVSAAQAAPQAPAAEASKPKASASRAGGLHPEYEPDYEDIELSNMRKVIAKRLVMSKVSEHLNNNNFLTIRLGKCSFSTL